MSRRFFLASLACAFGIGSAAVPPFLPGAGPVPPPTAADSARPAITDSAAARAATSATSAGPGDPAPAPPSSVPAPLSAGAVPGDSLRAAGGAPAPAPDSLRRAASDSLGARPARPIFRWRSPLAADTCRAAEGALPCWRGERDLANQEIAFPGARAWSLSLTHWRPLPQSSPYFLFWKDSPYLSGGLPPPQGYALHRTGGDADGIEEAWTPVAPLDTPVTRLAWTRGALTLNQFDLRLERMLSDRAYLGLEYYTSSADSMTYDYQFNVHQPYLSGWGFLGKLYGPIDRDSASLVLGGTSHALHALVARPRIGFWLAPGRVLEVFLDQTRNSSSLAYPTGLPASGASLIPAGPDSLQALMPSRFSSLAQGVALGETHDSWTGQFEIAHGSAELGETVGRGTGAKREAFEGEVFRARARAKADGLPWAPYVSAQAQSESWSGPPFGAASPGSEGWGDAEDAEAGAAPRLGPLSLDVSAGIGRSSRMADRVEWLPRYGGRARLDLPFGFSAEASASSRAEDPSWQVLYRTNPARFRHAGPDLRPRTDRTARASLAWAWSRFSLEGGYDRYDGKDVWLPRVLPGSDACAALADSAYQGLAGVPCIDSAGTPPRLPDSLALGLRNYERGVVEAWHLGTGLGLGNWSLDLRERFVLSRRVEDPDLEGPFSDRSIPERVFQGKLGWGRGLLEGRLRLDLAWTWEWFSTRYAWAPDLSGRSGLAKLDEYLVLDFDARMRIKTFLLFFKVANLNHDRYATEPGVHPPGLNFRFGVDWTIFN